MAMLFVEHEGVRQAGRVIGRVLIGRQPASQIVLRERAVSRIHAWIDTTEDGNGYYIADSGSRSGTFVNGSRLKGRTLLLGGEEITVGSARLRLEMHDEPPAGVLEIDLSAKPTAPPSPETGIFLDCQCGAPLWVPWEYSGRSGQCRWCSATVSVPGSAGEVIRRSRKSPNGKAAVVAAPAAPSPPNRVTSEAFEPEQPATEEPVCGVCHSCVSVFEQSTRCPECATAFHVECWTENRGCSAYGCSHVAILDQVEEPHTNGTPNGAATQADVPEIVVEIEQPPAPPFPWEFVVLAGSVVGTLLGALSFGVPALLAAAASVWYLRQRAVVSARPKAKLVLWLALSLAVVGVIAGVTISWFWWFGGKHDGR